MSPLNTLLVNEFITFTLVLSRVSGLVMVAPIFGSTTIPLRVRALLSVALSLVVLPTFVGQGPPYPGTTLNYLVLIGGEVLVGLTLGLGVQILFAGIQVAGQIIGQLSGMALADVFDPAFNASSPIFTQILYYVTIAVFVIIGGHRVLMAALLDTFEVMPPGVANISAPMVEALVTALAQSFVVGIRAAAPVMTALLLTTFVLGLVSRTLPQLNILAVGFGLNSLVTQAALLLSLGGAVWVFQDQVEPMLDTLQQALLKGAVVK
jgi:flagellar biosynthetic protein FliR